MNMQRVERRPARSVWRSPRVVSHLRRAFVVACALLSLCSSDAQAQQPKLTPVEVENAELRRRVQALEERLEKLEAQQQRQRQAEESPAKESAVAPVPGASPVAETPAPPKPPEEDGLLNFFKQTEVSGFIDTYYSYNFNRPASRTNEARSFDRRHNQFAFNVAEISFEKVPDKTSRLGFRLDLNFGPAADILSSAEPGGVEVYKNIQEAYGSYLAPFGKGLRFDVGKFGAWMGAEEDEAKDNWNYSRGLLYTFAQPAYHTGVRAAYAFNDKLSLTGAVVNGWSNIEENNNGKTYGFLLSLSPTSKLTVDQSYMFGPEQPDDQRHKRHLFDTVISYDINKRLSVMGIYDYGFDTLTDGTKVRWQGAGALLRYAPTKRTAFSPRFEWYGDYDGFTTGTAQRLKEITLTGEYKLRGNLLSRLEYRRDWSDQPFFQRADPNLFSRTQTTMLGGLIWSFSSNDLKASEQPDDAGGTPVEPSTRITRTQSPTSVQASVVKPNQQPRAEAATGERRARRSNRAERTPASPSQTHTAASSEPARTASPAYTVKITDRLPPPTRASNAGRQPQGH